MLSGFFGSTGIYSTHSITDKMKKKAEYIMNFLDIKKLSERRMEIFSSGEVNRFLVARALVNEPEVLIFDEPTTNLDLKAGLKFLSYIRNITQKGKTIIIVTHDLHDIIPEINNVIFLKQGKIFKAGNKKELLNSKNISKLFDIKLEVPEENKYYYAFIN